MSVSALGTRVSNTLLTQLATRNINNGMRDLLTLQYQLSSGLRLYKTSVDPGGSAVAMSFQNIIERRQQATTNIDRANEFLASTDSALGDLQDLLNQAIDIASSNVGSGSDNSARQNAATVIGSLITQMAQLGNRQYEGRYLFAGQSTNEAPFDLSSTQVCFVGDQESLQTIIDRTDSIQYNVTAAEAFGTLSGAVTSIVDLNPGLTVATRLSELNSGQGVRLGTISVSDGAVTAQVDLSGCSTVGDVIDAINNGGTAATAGLNPAGNGLTLTVGAGDTVSVADLPGGFAAADLGILQQTPLAAGVALVGTDLNRTLTSITELTALKNGAGIDRVNGMILTVGDESRTIDLSAATTMEDLLNAVNYCGLNVQASLTADGRGITIANAVASEAMTIGENGGTTATNLGVRSMHAGTVLADLNDGQGVRVNEDGLADFTISCHDGTNVSVSLLGCVTVQQAITAINTAGAGKVTAAIATTGNGIVLTDTTAGAGAFQVAAANSSYAAEDLGLEKSAGAGATIAGDDVNPIYEQGVFRFLYDLRDALLANDSASVTKAGESLTAEISRVARVRGVVGVRMQSLEASATRIEDELLQVKDLLSEVRDLDYAEAVSRFQTLQTTFEASLQTAANILPLTLLDFLS
jgi:flagellar hook-associated protein 3 FlgL